MAAALRRHLAARLPEYMLPASFVMIDALPLNANGKIDAGALPDPVEVGKPSMADRAAPRDDVERTICRLWSEVLRRDPVGIDDDFFDNGGHSLLAAALFARLIEELGVSLPLSVLFEAPTVRQLADHCRLHRRSDVRKGLVAITRTGALPLAFVVPGVYGNVIGYAELAHALGPDQPLYGLQAVGLDGAEPPVDVDRAHGLALSGRNPLGATARAVCVHRRLLRCDGRLRNGPASAAGRRRSRAARLARSHVAWRQRRRCTPNSRASVRRPGQGAGRVRGGTCAAVC